LVLGEGKEIGMARVIRGERGSMAYFEFLDFGDAGREK
jgi:hypothetical protein